MNLSLESITFVKTPLSAAPLQMKIRVPLPPKPDNPHRWIRRLVGAPEWPPRLGNARRSPVLFPLCFTGGKGIDVQVRVHSTEPGEFQVRARALSEGNIMGSLKPAKVRFSAPGCETCDPVLDAPRLSEWDLHQVDSHWDRWLWEAAPVGSDDFQPFARTRHQVFTTLGVPRSPWDFVGPEFPWFEAVRIACMLARGSRSVNEAATSITRKVYSLGERGGARRLRYSQAVAHYTSDVFDCEAFLEFLTHAERWRSSCVDCHDVASLISTLVNVLGGNLYQADMIAKDGGSFQTQPIRLIGRHGFKPAEFGEHEVAWGGGAGRGDPVWDGCLAFPARKGVGQGPPVNPVGFAFSGNSYRGRLIDGDQKVGPRGTAGGFGQNREFGQAVKDDRSALRPLSPLPPPPDQDGHVFVLRFAPSAIADYTILAWRQQILGPGLIAFSSIWDGGPKPDRRLEIKTIPAESESAALAYLQRVMSHFSLPVRRLHPFPELAYGSPAGGVVVMVLDNLYLQISTIGLHPVKVRPIALQLSSNLRKDPVTSRDQPVPPDGVSVNEVFANLHSKPQDIDSVFLRSASPLYLERDVLRSTSPAFRPPASVSAPNALLKAFPTL